MIKAIFLVLIVPRLIRRIIPILGTYFGVIIILDTFRVITIHTAFKFIIMHQASFMVISIHIV